MSNLLRQRAVDIRTIKSSIDSLSQFDPLTDIVVFKGIKKCISLEGLGGKFELIGKDLQVLQSDVEVYSLSNPKEKKVVHIVEIHSTKESSLQTFIAELELMDHWNICSYSEFIHSVLHDTQVPQQ